MAINTQYHQVIIRKIFACGIQNPRKFCLWNLESRALESEIQLKETGIPLTIGIQKSSSTVKDWNPVPGIRNPRRGIQDPRDQDCLGFPFTGRHIFYFHCLVFHFISFIFHVTMRCFRAKKVVHKLDEYISHRRCPLKEKLMIAKARNLNCNVY